MKKCSRCKIEKTIDCFGPGAARNDGKTTQCQECRKLTASEYYYRNKKKCASATLNWRERNKEKTTKWAANYYLENKNRFKAYGQAWRKENKGKRNAITRKYQAAKKRFHLGFDEQIKEFYILAQELQWLSIEPLEVDHIIPLQGKIVSGLHVPWNLQIIPMSVNRRKSARFSHA